MVSSWASIENRILLEKICLQSPDEWFESLTKELDEDQVKTTDESIKDRTMSVESQPPTDIRRRYETDGKRQIEKSRSKPMAIKVDL